MREMSLSDFTPAGEGGTAFTYDYKKDDNIMLKLFKDEVAKEEVIKEYETNKKIENFGFNIPKVIEMVRVNGKVGILFERIKDKISFSRMMSNDRTKIEYCAKEMAKYAKVLHATPCDVTMFRNKKDYVRETILKSTLSKEVQDLLMKKISLVEDKDTCLHGDFQPSNFIYQNGNVYMIDLGNFSYGNPMFDIGSLYFTCCIIITEKEKIDIFHMDLKDLKLFFDIFAKCYVGDDEVKLKVFYKEAKEFGALFMATVFYILGKPLEKKEIYENKIKELLSDSFIFL